MARIKFFKGSKKTYIDHINDSKYLDSLYFTTPNTEIDPSHGTLYINNIAYDGIEIVNVSTDLSSLTNTRLGQIVFSKGDHASFLHIDDQTWSQLGTTSTIDINSLNAKVDDLSIFTHNLNSSVLDLSTNVIPTINSSISDLKLSVKTNKDSIDSLQTNINTIDTNISNINTSIGDISTRLSHLSGVYKYQGSVATYNNLPLIDKVSNGDVYNVLDTGMNYAAIVENNTLTWDALGSTVDLSDYVTKENLNSSLANYVTQTALNTSLGYYVTKENLNNSLDALNTSIGNNYITQVTYYQDISTHADDGSVYVKGINISAIPQWEENN